MKMVKLFEDWIDSVEDDPELMEMEQEEYDEYYDEDMKDEDMEDEDEDFPDGDYMEDWEANLPLFHISAE